MDEPREALPPCIRGLEIFDGNQVCWHDMGRCPLPIPTNDRHVVTAGHKTITLGERDCTKGAIRKIRYPAAVDEGTDDETEAEAHYKRGVEWLRGLTAMVPPV